MIFWPQRTDSIEKNKWRIENREQLREQRKKELKELMEKEITMDSGSVQWFFDQLVANRIIVINGSTYWDKVKAKHEMLLEQAKEMEKEKTIKFTEDWYFNGPLLGEGIDVKSTIEQH